MNAIELSLFSARINAICEEMGAVLRQAAFSPNIRDRLDFSCAVFDAQGQLCAQAAHIPVHLGSMAYAMGGIVERMQWRPGDMVVLNDPFLGGTHLPDVTVIAPLYVENRLLGFVANRAHHADIGAKTPGSMPLSSELFEEGVVISPVYLVRAGDARFDVLDALMERAHSQLIVRGDFSAQISANRTGLARLKSLIESYSSSGYLDALAALNDYAERLAAKALARIPDGHYAFTDVLDDDGFEHYDLPITVALSVAGGRVTVDFTGTAAQTEGNINCPLAVAAAAVYYVFRCLMPAQTPPSAGSFRTIEVHAPEGCLVNAHKPAAVAAGNVETSTRVVDTVLGALAQALPEEIPAASHGSMNNLAMGAAEGEEGWDYYETLGGGMGAHALGPGLSAVQTHMTNTLNTPIETLEMTYPLRIRQYAQRRNSGGGGRFLGGDGLVRDYEFLKPSTVTVLSERRRHAPWGLHGGASGKLGQNYLNDDPMPGKFSVIVAEHGRLRVATAGGGGYGRDKR